MTHEPIWAVGLMTGTVLDGNIDVALLKTNGVEIVDVGGYCLSPYTATTVSLLREAVEQAQEWQFGDVEPDVFAEATQRLTMEQGQAVQSLLQDSGLSTDDIGVVGFHGQTVLHRPPQKNRLGQTRQLGDGKLMAQALGIPVVNDFRSEDMRLGGHGAPLCGIYHQALLRPLSASGDIAVLNLGGIGNVSWWDGGDRLIAFDTGPANAPINDFVRQCGAGTMDVDGQFAAKGSVNEAMLRHNLAHEYFNKAYPKSLDRFDFTASMAEGETLENGVALLTAFSAACVGKALDLLPSRPTKLIVCGGGRHNLSLLKALSHYAGVEVSTAEAYGWRQVCQRLYLAAYITAS